MLFFAILFPKFAAKISTGQLKTEKLYFKIAKKGNILKEKEIRPASLAFRTAFYVIGGKFLFPGSIHHGCQPLLFHLFPVK